MTTYLHKPQNSKGWKQITESYKTCMALTLPIFVQDESRGLTDLRTKEVENSQQVTHWKPQETNMRTAEAIKDCPNEWSTR